MKNRSELRESIVRILYQILIYEETKNSYDLSSLIQEEIKVKNEFVTDCVTGILNHRKEIETLANQYLVDWEMKRLSKVDQGILSLGIYELLYTDTPSIVAINEAVELSKKYSEEKVSSMINAVLDSIFHDEEKKAE